jgi:DNA-binding NarL/FixJ family response regulator
MAAELTQTEINQLLKAIAWGKSNSEIARDLQITGDMVKWRVSKLLKSLNLFHRIELAMYCIEHTLTEQERLEWLANDFVQAYLVGEREFTPQQKKIAEYVSAHPEVGNTAVARVFYVSEHTVKTHLRRAYVHCGFSGRNVRLLLTVAYQLCKNRTGIPRVATPRVAPPTDQL